MVEVSTTDSERGLFSGTITVGRQESTTNRTKHITLLSELVGALILLDNYRGGRQFLFYLVE